MEVLRLHYHYTIRHWRTRFAARRDEALALTDERFCRMWEFYLAAVELDFLHGTHMVFQKLLSPSATRCRSCGTSCWPRLASTSQMADYLGSYCFGEIGRKHSGRCSHAVNSPELR